MEKALAAAAIALKRADLAPCLTLAADTVVCVGRRILPKCEAADEAEACLKLLSGRAHRVFTGLALVTPSGAARRRLVETRLRFKRLSRNEFEAYLKSGEWRGKAGGYAIQGLAGAFVERLVGSYSECRRPSARRNCGAARRRRLSCPPAMGREPRPMTANDNTPPAHSRR